MNAYADTSFLVALYVPQSHSEQAAKWVASCRTPLPVTPFGVHEFKNAISLLAFRQHLSTADELALCHEFETDLAHGRVDGDLSASLGVGATPVWHDVFAQADRLREDFTAILGVRGMDILHVAAALSLGATVFLTFDDRQKALATKAGLKVRPA